MTELVLSIDIAAPVERCFDLARSMDFHVWSMRDCGETIVDGRDSGLIGLHEEVEFEATHLRTRWRLRAAVVAIDRPRWFADQQVRGPFKRMRHEHAFEVLTPEVTRMTDRLAFDVRWFMGGRLAARWAALPRLRSVLRRHQQHLKDTAEGERWKDFLKA